MKSFNEEIEKVAKAFNRPPIYDGIVNEEEYVGSEVKVMWVLKEANSSEEESYDLRGAISDLKTENGIKKDWEYTFKNIIYVTNGILNKMDWESIPYPHEEPKIVDVLKQIAYINIKKVSGGSEAVGSELHEHYQHTKELLFNQIEEFNPDVIIFGGTFHFFENDLDLNQLNIFGTCNATAKSDRIYINAYHPNARIKGQQYFEGILRAYNAFKKEVDNINDLTYTNETYENDLNILSGNIKGSINQIRKIENKLINVNKYEELSLIKPLNEYMKKATTKCNDLMERDK